MTSDPPYWTDTPDLSGHRVALIHREILRKLEYHRAQYQEAQEPTDDPKLDRERAVSSTYNYAAEGTLRDVLGLLETCIDSERRERAAYAAADQDR